TGVDCSLKISMKSLVYVDPELPPPPKTWLIFTVVGAGGDCTMRDAVVELLRAWASLIEMGRVFVPGVVPLATVAWNENTLSLGVTSPWVPSSKNCCDADPPIRLKSPTTPMPVLRGFVPGVTFTVRRVEPPACRLLGFAEAIPIGGVVKEVTVR